MNIPANWITASGNPDVFPAEVSERRFLLLTLGCEIVSLDDWRREKAERVEVTS